MKQKHNIIYDGNYYGCTCGKAVGNLFRLMQVHCYDENKKLFKGKNIHPVDLMPEIEERYKW